VTSLLGAPDEVALILSSPNQRVQWDVYLKEVTILSEKPLKYSATYADGRKETVTVTFHKMDADRYYAMEKTDSSERLFEMQ
jgi:hypothetical protein